MATHQLPPTKDISVRQEQSHDLPFAENDHDLVRHTLAWCEVEEGRVPTELLDQLLKTTKTSFGIPHHANLGWMLSQCQRSNEAINRLYKELDADPDSDELKLFAAISLQRTRDFKTSKMVLRRLLEKSPQNFPARKHYANALMNIGLWSEGFVELEKSRGGLTPLQHEFCGEISRLWMGQEIKGRHIVIVGNDRLSDQLQFSRYVDQLRALQPRMIGFSCSTELVELMRSLREINRVDNNRFEPYDYFVPVESLPFRLGATPSTLPNAPYLQCNSRNAEARKAHFGNAKPLLGICWRNYEIEAADDACVRYARMANSLDLAHLEPYLKELSKFYDIVSLQPDVDFGEREFLARHNIKIAGREEFEDYEMLAELISCLDNLITVGSPIAHLAGALGLEAHVLLPHVSEWKWCVESKTSRWYPKLKIHEKRSENCWSECLGEAMAELQVGLELQKVS